MEDTKETILEDNNTLLLSEKDQKAFLPYKLKDVREFIQKYSIYESEEEVIEKFYTVPLELYKYPSIARFKEAFNLARMEKYSFWQALELGFEVMFKYNLNPAIITACKNMDEFDIYLACLDGNELENFKCFDIIYSFAPTVIATES